MDFSFSDLNFNSVETLPGFEARATFTVNSSSVFKEDVDIVPTIVDDSLSYIPWGGDNQMPFDLLALVEKDETLATCQCFNAEVCYGSGLQYCASEASASVKSAVDDFLLDNDLAAYFLGICQDFKHFGFAVSVLILNEDGSRIVRLLRKEACYCRFTPANRDGRIEKILYANWRKSVSSRKEIEEIELLDPASPWRDLQDKLAKKSKCRKFAIVSRIPTVDSTYYPIPYYGALFRGKWYNIKQLIGIAKEAKLKNSAPIKYHIEVGAKYWESIFRAEGITDRRKQQYPLSATSLTSPTIRSNAPKVQESSSPSFISLPMAKRPKVDDTDDSTCQWSDIFTFNRTFATMLVIEKFSDCLEYVSSINIHEQDY